MSGGAVYGEPRVAAATAEYDSLPSRPRDRGFRDPDFGGGGLTMVLEQCAEFGGMERIARLVMERWPETRVVTPRFRDDAGPTLFPGATHIDFAGSRTHFRAPLHALRMQRAVRLDGEVVLALHSSGWALGPRAAPGVPVVAFTNGTPRWMGLQMPFYVRDRAWLVRVAARASLPLHDRVQRRLRARADVILACSEYAAAKLPEPVSVLHPPVAVEQFTGPGDPDGHVVAVARLVAHKRIDVLVEAMRGRRERLFVVGAGPELARLRRDAPANVEFTGQIDDDQLAVLLGGARALVHPTFEEFGIVMAEALASGVPVIAPRAGGALEIVEDGRTGHLLAQVTPTTIRNALDDLEFDPVTCREGAERFGPERFVDELGAILDAARNAARR